MSLVVASFRAALVDDLLVPTLALTVAVLALAAIRRGRLSRTTVAGATVTAATAFLVPLALTQGWSSVKALDSQRRAQHFSVERARLGCVVGDRMESGFVQLARGTIPPSARYSITVGRVAVPTSAPLCLAQVLLPRRPVARVGQAPWLVLYGVAPRKQRTLVRGGRLVVLTGHPELAVGRLGSRAR